MTGKKQKNTNDPNTGWLVYILRCADNTLYTGITNHLEKRLKAHNAGKASKYTRVRLPVEVVYSEEVEDKSAALRRECEIKQLSRQEKLKITEHF